MSNHMFYHYPNYQQQRRKRFHNTGYILTKRKKTPQNTDRTFRYVLQSESLSSQLKWYGAYWLAALYLGYTYGSGAKNGMALNA